MSEYAALLRRAAAHIRYLAGDPVEWGMGSHDWVNFEVYEDEPKGWVRKLIARTLFRPTRAMHVAAWDPKAAHLVADWLESASDLHEPPNRPPGCQWCADEDWPCADMRHAEAVARAVLGEEPTE